MNTPTRPGPVHNAPADQGRGIVAKARAKTDGAASTARAVGRTGMRHLARCSPADVAVGLAPALAGGGTIGFATYLFGSIIPLPVPLYVQVDAAQTLATCTGALSFLAAWSTLAIGRQRNRHRVAMEADRLETKADIPQADAILRLMVDPGGQLHEAVGRRRIKAYRNGRDIIAAADHAHPVHRRTIRKLAAINRMIEDAERDVGRTGAVERKAVAIEAALAVVESAMIECRDIDGANLDTARRRAPAAMDELRAGIHSLLGDAADPHRAPAGTGRAHVDRLIARAEEALAIDPDLVDAGGARIDHAIRWHLPDLLSAHAVSAARARIEDLSEIDRMLEDGLELIRASVEEGMATLRHRSADALRTEVRFLAMRRDGTDPFGWKPGA